MTQHIFAHVDRLMNEALTTLQELEENQQRIIAECTPAQLKTVQHAKSKGWIINQMQDNTVEMFSQKATDHLYVSSDGKYSRK